MPLPIPDIRRYTNKPAFPSREQYFTSSCTWNRDFFFGCFTFNLMTNSFLMLTSFVELDYFPATQYFSIILHLDQDLIFGGSFDPAAYAEISSIGAIGGEKNKTIVKDITAVVNEHLGVPSDRFYVKVGFAF